MAKYLMHFNMNHSPKNGQFIAGDGDGDGIIDDHRNQRNESSYNTRRSDGSLAKGKYSSRGNEKKRYFTKFLRASVFGMPITATSSLVGMVGTESNARQFWKGAVSGKPLSAIGAVGKAATSEIGYRTSNLPEIRKLR